MPTNGTDGPFEVSYPSFSRVAPDDGADGVFRNVALFGREARGRELTFDQIALRDFKLLVLGIARKLDDLHPVSHRPRPGVEHVGCADEHDLGEIERHGKI